MSAVFHSLSRRRFLQTTSSAAASLVIGFYLPPARAQSDAPESYPLDVKPEPDFLNAYLRINADNTVTIMVPSAEMGQGVYTSQPITVAEELEIEPHQIRAELAPDGKAYYNRMFRSQGTGGSTSTRWSFDVLRQLGANTRELLRQAAAQQWAVPASEISAAKGHMTHTPSGRQLRYADLGATAATLPAVDDVSLKPPAQWKLLGTSFQRLDVPMKVNGSAPFGIDVQLDGLLVATLQACPVYGGKLQSVDDAPALAVKGVRHVVRLPDAVAVVADGYWPALKGLRELQPVWDYGTHRNNTSEEISKQLHGNMSRQGSPALETGDFKAAEQLAAKTVSAVYEVPFLAHATMEPMNATAHVHQDGVDMWLPTQSTTATVKMVSAATNIPPERIKVHPTFLGGGFGRRSRNDFAGQAALISQAVKAPVKLVWSREEDMRQDGFRPAAVARLSATLDDANRVTGFHTRISAPSITRAAWNPEAKDDRMAVEGIADTEYGFPSAHVDYVVAETGVPVWFWRSVGHSQNAFFLETFIEELAEGAGKDGVALRRELLSRHPRHLQVMDTLLAKADWGRPSPGRVQGLALVKSYGSTVGQIVEASVSDSREIKLHKITCVVDCGVAINPDTIAAQMESSIVYGLTAAMYGRISIRDGTAEQQNFNEYEMLRLKQLPPIDTVILELGDKPGGIGEAGLPPLAPALVNALHAATGQRIRTLPLNGQGFKLV